MELVEVYDLGRLSGKVGFLCYGRLAGPLVKLLGAGWSGALSLDLLRERGGYVRPLADREKAARLSEGEAESFGLQIDTLDPYYDDNLSKMVSSRTDKMAGYRELERQGAKVFYGCDGETVRRELDADDARVEAEIADADNRRAAAAYAEKLAGRRDLRGDGFAEMVIDCFRGIARG